MLRFDLTTLLSSITERYVNGLSFTRLKAIINSIGKARENSIVEKDVKKIKKC